MRQGPKTLVLYRTAAGSQPFVDWFEAIRAPSVRYRVAVRLDRLEAGNPGDSKALGEGLYELRLSFGAGYRVYMGEIDEVRVLLLAGGDKSSQSRDIVRAKAFWADYRDRT